MRDWMWVLGALLLLAGGFFLQQSGLLSPVADPAVRNVIDSDCDLREGDCQLLLGNAPVLFSVKPKDIRVLKPLTLRVIQPAGNGPALQRVSVEFEGVNMDMGYNRVFLEADEQGGFSGSGILPACTAEKMIWRIHLLLETSTATHDFRFGLETASH